MSLRLLETNLSHMISMPALILLSLVLITSADAQTGAAPTPPSFQLSLTSANVPTSTMAPVDNVALMAEDDAEYAAAEATGAAMPGYRTAFPLDVSLNFANGTWETLPNGDRIWRLRIESPGATDLCLRYDGWRLVKPCELWLYNDDHSSLLGPYTYIDNWDGTNATAFTKGDAVTLEYLVPAGVEDYGELSISHVAHGYKHLLDRHADDALDNFGDAMACNINVRCWPDYVEERASVAMIMLPNTGRWCTGTMLNNTLQDGAPNFLTADHCWRSDVNNWIFMWNYESPACSPTTDGQTNLTITNANVLARVDTANGSDFLLLRLSRPRPDGAYIPRFMGWDRDNIAPSQTWGIHHPRGDVKKISHDNNPAVSSDWNGQSANNYWRVEWDQGITEPGSSGSPVFSTGSYVVGQLTGGSSDCVVETDEVDKYGKLSSSWNGLGTPSTRLRDWLDPNNSGATYVNSWQPTGPPNDSCNQPGFQTITALPFSQSGSTQFAANDFNTLNCNTNTSPELIYMLRLDCDYTVTVSTCGSSYDTQLMVYAATSCMGWSFLVDCNDDFCGVGSQVTFNAAGAQLYVIVLEGYGSAYGNYVFNITGVANGSQGNAACPGYEITEVPYFTYGANYCGGDNVVMNCRPSSQGNDVHWYWHSPYNQAMRAKTCYINYDTILEVRVGPGSSCGEYLVGCNDDTPCGLDNLASSVVFDASANGWYYFHLDGYNGASGMASFELEVYNDDCTSPIVVPSLQANYEGDTRPAADDFATIVGPNSKEVFFQYTSPVCQTLVVSTCDANYTLYDTGLEVRTGGPCPGSTVVAYNDDYPGCGLMSQLYFSAEANRTYYIIVGGYGTDAGQFMVYFNYIPNDPPDNPLADVCPGILIPSLPFTDYGNTGCMAANYTNCVTATSPEMVYHFSRPSCEIVTVSLCGSGYDTGLGIYGGICPNIAPLVVCNDDNYCGANYTLQSTATFTAEANTNYQILVHGYGGNYGPYVINVNSTPCPPAPPQDVVAQVDIANGDVILNWDPIPGADLYHVYRSQDFATLFSPGNIIASIGTTYFICDNCLNGPEPRGFFGVVAADQPGPFGPLSEPPRDIAGLTKADAIPTVISDAFADPFPVDMGVPMNTGKPESDAQGVHLPPSITNPAQQVLPPIEYRPPVRK